MNNVVLEIIQPMLKSLGDFNFMSKWIKSKNNLK